MFGRSAQLYLTVHVAYSYLYRLRFLFRFFLLCLRLSGPQWEKNRSKIGPCVTQFGRYCNYVLYFLPFWPYFHPKICSQCDWNDFSHFSPLNCQKAILCIIGLANRSVGAFKQIGDTIKPIISQYLIQIKWNQLFYCEHFNFWFQWELFNILNAVVYAHLMCFQIITLHLIARHSEMPVLKTDFVMCFCSTAIAFKNNIRFRMRMANESTQLE